MKKIYILIVLFSICSTFAQKQKIERELDSLKNNGHKIVTLTFNYSNISCPCAQWAESKFNGEKGCDKRVQTYLEPANDSIEKLIKVDNFPFKVRVTGEYVSKKGYPKDFKQTKGFAEPAPVFKVYKTKVLKRG